MKGTFTTELMSVLVLAGIEVIFFTVAGMGLCLGLVLDTELIIEMFLVLLSRACTEPFRFSYHHIGKGIEGAQEVWKGHRWDR